MKSILISLMCFSLLFASNLQAKDEYIDKGVPAGYTAIISFTNNSELRINESTFELCQQSLNQFTRGRDSSQNKEGIIVKGLVVSRTSSCLSSYAHGLLSYVSGDLILNGFVFPLGPKCWSCPALNESTFDLFYNDYSSEIASLYNDYNIASYNQRLEELQSEYDLTGF
jgi:hypothetical protein